MITKQTKSIKQFYRELKGYTGVQWDSATKHRVFSQSEGARLLTWRRGQHRIRLLSQRRIPWPFCGPTRRRACRSTLDCYEEGWCTSSRHRCDWFFPLSGGTPTMNWRTERGSIRSWRQRRWRRCWDDRRAFLFLPCCQEGATGRVQRFSPTIWIGDRKEGAYILFVVERLGFGINALQRPGGGRELEVNKGFRRIPCWWPHIFEQVW